MAPVTLDLRGKALSAAVLTPGSVTEPAALPERAWPLLRPRVSQHRSKAARLAVPKPRVYPVFREKHRVRARFHDPPMIQYNQSIHPGDRRKTMRDRDNRAPLHQTIELALNRCLHLRI